MSKFERITYIRPAYDKRNPDPSKNYGIHGAELIFILKGEKGAVQFLISTNWYLPHVAAELRKKDHFSSGKSWFEPQPSAIGYHSPKPMYEDQTQANESCEYLDGKPCYYGDSITYSEVPFQVLISKGSDAMWVWMENYYKEKFGEEKTNEICKNNSRTSF